MNLHGDLQQSGFARVKKGLKIGMAYPVVLGEMGLGGLLNDGNDETY